MKNNNKKRLTILLDREVYDGIVKLATEDGRYLTQWIRYTITKILNDNKNK